MKAANDNRPHQELLVHEDNLEQFRTEHTHLEEKIIGLEKLRFPTVSEESQIKQLKKEKLSLKEKIEKIQLQGEKVKSKSNR
jgi:hypothetical protein